MNSLILEKLINLCIRLLITLLIWSFYRRRTVTTDERYSTFWPRFWTGFVDSCVLWPVGFLVVVLRSIDIPPVPAKLFAVWMVAAAVPSFAWYLYTVVMHARCGQTVGKMATKVRVVDYRTEESISWRQAWLREGIPMAMSLGLLVVDVVMFLAGDATGKHFPGRGFLLSVKGYWLLMYLPLLWFLAEILTMLTNQKRRALHDFIAGTVVVRTNATEESVQPDVYVPDGVPRSGEPGML